MPVQKLDTAGRKSGFQRSETSSAQLTVYRHGDDPVLGNQGGTLEFNGRSIRDPAPSLIGLSTSKSLNGGGSWSATIKDGTPLARDTDLRDDVVDDDWADIVFLRHNRPWHVMRGLVERIQRRAQVAGQGATSVTYTLSGRDFGSIWERTPLWFNKYITPGNAGENIVGGLAMQVFNSLNVGGSVEATVTAFLFGFLQQLGNLGRANWEMPVGMPGVAANSAFIDNVLFDPRGFTNTPARVSINPNFMDPNGAGAWQMAQEWSDPAFCELWYDIAPSTSTFSVTNALGGAVTEAAFSAFVESRQDEQLRPGDTQMALFLRDRPFPTTGAGIDSPWFSLPTVVVNREDILMDDVGRGGTERFNAFFLSPQITQEVLGSAAIEVTAPLWDTGRRGMQRHGFRRYDIMSRYSLDVANAADASGGLLTLTKAQRQQIRDWYAINPYLYSGTIQLGHGRPDARVGMRLKIPGRTEDDNETYYIEEVNHDWVFGQGIRTSFGVTRGWRGSDDAYVSAIDTLAARYGGNRQG